MDAGIGAVAGALRRDPSGALVGRQAACTCSYAYAQMYFRIDTSSRGSTIDAWVSKGESVAATAAFRTTVSLGATFGPIAGDLGIVAA